SGLYVGEIYGLSEANGGATANSDVSQRSELVLSATMPGFLLDYAQVEFMMAEAAERGWGTDAESHYKAGITASILFWTSLNGAPADQPTIDAYIAQDSVDYTLQKASAASSGFAMPWKYAIGKQKWIALYDQGIQGWCEWRRLDFGILDLPQDGVLDGTGIPLRMKYPVDEQTLNGANYDAAVANQGPDLQNTRLWWDVN
ncbi:MAG: SusD/RagB family nutrient-binding outer membrane lipoprotein, partial [Bacteroidota bacterium]